MELPSEKSICYLFTAHFIWYRRRVRKTIWYKLNLKYIFCVYFIKIKCYLFVNFQIVFFVRCTKYTAPPAAYCVIAKKIEVVGINKIYFYSTKAGDITIGVYTVGLCKKFYEVPGISCQNFDQTYCFPSVLVFPSAQWIKKTHSAHRVKRCSEQR